MFRAIALTLLVASTLLAEEGADDGFVPLFDGKTLDGWVQRGGEADYTIEADAEGGAQIVGTSVADTPNSFLCTDRDYGDFILEFEVKVDPPLNSGVQFRSLCYDEPKTVTNVNAAGEKKQRTFPAGRVHGYQAEIDPSPRAWSGGVYDEGRRGWLYNLEGDDKAAARAAFNPEGWNHYQIEAYGDHISTQVNGVPVAHLHDDMTPSGFIALQVHRIGNPAQVGKQIRWRNIKIKELSH